MTVLFRVRKVRRHIGRARSEPLSEAVICGDAYSCCEEEWFELDCAEAAETDCADLCAIGPYPKGAPFDQQFAYSWAGTSRETVYTDRRGEEWLHRYSFRGNLVLRRNPLDAEWSYVYDTAKRVVTLMTDPESEEWTATTGFVEFEYDARKRLRRETRSVGGMDMPGAGVGYSRR